MKFILARKVNMSQIFTEEGKVIPVTIVKVEKVKITQVKTASKDGYNAVQLGTGEKKKLTKPLQGHLKKLPPFRWLREFIVPEKEISDNRWQRGQELSVDTFKEGDKVTVQGVSKGKGFQGVMKRHGFKGAPHSHGTKDRWRAPGSIGATTPQRVIPGKHMAGRMGNEQITLRKVKIVKIDKDKGELYLKGAVPGRRGSLLKISGE